MIGGGKSVVFVLLSSSISFSSAGLPGKVKSHNVSLKRKEFLMMWRIYSLKILMRTVMMKPNNKAPN